MASLLCLGLGIILLCSNCLWPWLNYHAQRQEREFQEVYKHFQLRTVQEYYEELNQLSLREIDDRYELESIYQKLGF